MLKHGVLSVAAVLLVFGVVTILHSRPARPPPVPLTPPPVAGRFTGRLPAKH